MATFDYENARATASRLIAQFGTARTTAGEQDGFKVVTGETGEAWDSVGTETFYPAQLVVVGYQKIESGNVQAGDKIVEVDAVGLEIEPTPEHKLLVGGEEHAIVRVEPLRPADVTIKYRVYARS